MSPIPESNRPFVRGFTLVELVVALSVAAILLAMAAPNFARLVRSNQRDSALYALIGDLQFARSESIKRSARLAVCARKPGSAQECNDSNAIDWGEGWLVFVDNGTDLGVYEAGTEELIRVGNAVNDEMDVFSRARVSTSAITEAEVNFIRFGPRGTSNWRGGGFVLMCDSETSDNSTSIAVNVTLSGDIRRARRDGDDNLVSAFGTTPACETS